MRDSADVRIATGPAVDEPLAWTTTRLFTVGGADHGFESFHDIGHAVRGDSAGKLYVLDKGNHRVVVFDSTGHVVAVYGSRGGGPGELERPTALVVDDKGVVSVFDNARRGFVRFGPDGSNLDVLPVPLFFGGERIALDESRVTHVRGVRLEPTDAGMLQLVTYDTGSEPVVMASRRRMAGKHVEYSNCPVSVGNIAPFLGPEIRWQWEGDRLLVQPDDRYRIEVRRSGELEMILQRPIAPLVVTQALAESVAEEEFGADGYVITFPYGRCVIAPRDMVEAHGYAESASAISSIRGSRDGAIWVRRLTSDGTHPIDLFANRGEYLGTLPAGTPFPDTFLGGDSYAVVERDAVGAEMVSVYRILRR
jgi:hypothetical protein